MLTRRKFLIHSTAAAAAAGAASILPAQSTLTPLDVASAGSVRAMLEGPLKTAAAQSLHLDLKAHSGGADSVAKSLVDGSLHADLFIPVTATPMRQLFQAGLAETAQPIARTELVLIYSPKSRFAPQLQAAAEGKANLWEVLQQPGLKVGRGNPAADPGARAILFAMMLAAKKYGQPDLVQKLLGAPQNPEQVGANVQEKLQSGELDLGATYKIGAGHGQLLSISLPEEVNLSRDDVHTANPETSLTLDGKTFYPDPLVFYAAQLKNAANPGGAESFLSWLQGQEAQSLFTANGFATAGPAISITHQ